MAVTITVQEIRQPAPGKKTGIVIDNTGKWWFVWPNVLGQFFAGVSYQIEYDSRSYMGKTYNTVKSVMPASGGQHPQNTSNSYAGSYTPPPPRPISVDTSDTQRRLDIFVCGAFNNLMSNPNVNPLDFDMMAMIDTLHKLRGAWNGVFGPSPLPKRIDPISSGQPQNNDLNDDVPF